MKKPTRSVSSVRGADPAASPEVAAFLDRLAAGRPAEGRGRLVFALDATMSRQPTWDLACTLQAEMFAAAADAGGLAVQLVYFRGHGEARASRWVADGAGLARLMAGIACHGGLTQIGRVLEHAEREAARQPPQRQRPQAEGQRHEQGPGRQAHGERSASSRRAAADPAASSAGRPPAAQAPTAASSARSSAAERPSNGR